MAARTRAEQRWRFSASARMVLTPAWSWCRRCRSVAGRRGRSWLLFLLRALLMMMRPATTPRGRPAAEDWRAMLVHASSGAALRGDSRDTAGLALLLGGAEVAHAGVGTS